MADFKSFDPIWKSLIWRPVTARLPIPSKVGTQIVNGCQISKCLTRFSKDFKCLRVWSANLAIMYPREALKRDNLYIATYTLKKL